MKFNHPSQSSPSRDFLSEAAQRLKFCVERGRLENMLNRASRDYAKAVFDFIDIQPRLSPAEYVRRRVEIEQARTDAEHCRQALLQHQQEHGC